mmetsp:Transcript_100528/g.230801  ORF Transcript_100528/g.230801 Transcript_100528/m.230801 type:complete len:214 (+) Transcript_100528:1044-1685(+)
MKSSTGRPRSTPTVSATCSCRQCFGRSRTHLLDGPQEISGPSCSTTASPRSPPVPPLTCGSPGSACPGPRAPSGSKSSGRARGAAMSPCCLRCRVWLALTSSYAPPHRTRPRRTTPPSKRFPSWPSARSRATECATAAGPAPSPGSTPPSATPLSSPQPPSISAPPRPPSATAPGPSPWLSRGRRAARWTPPTGRSRWSRGSPAGLRRALSLP